METKTQRRGKAAHRCPPKDGSVRRATRYALGVALVSVAACGPSAFAEIYDDFESATRSATLWTNWPWNGTGGATVTNGHVKLDLTPPANQYGFYNLISYRTWTLREGRTLEFRVDLLGCNADGAVAYFGFHLNDGFSGYNILVDRDTIALLKRNTPQLFFVNNGPTVDVSNIKLVVSMTGVTNSVHLKFKILDNDNAGAVIFQKDYWDTPATDPMQVGTDSPPGSYLGQTGSLALVLARDTGIIDPSVPPLTTAEVIYDNAEVFEYDVPDAEITRSVLLSWSANTEEEQIVVGSGSPAGPVWTPWPEPIFKRFGQWCMTVPITAEQQYFRLVPGSQFVDDFSDSWGPFTNRNSWTSVVQNTGEEWMVTNGVLQVDWSTPNPWPLFGLLPLGTNVAAELRDMYASVDILDWVTSGANMASFFLEVRAIVGTDGGVGCAGGLDVNANDIPGRIGLWLIVDGVQTAPTFDTQAFPPPYRLQLSAVGTRVSVRVLSLRTGQVIRELGVNSLTYTKGLSGVAFGGRSNLGDFYTARFDNFFLTGTRP